jgi:hypothetical protein
MSGDDPFSFAVARRAGIRSAVGLENSGRLMAIRFASALGHPEVRIGMRAIVRPAAFNSV